MSISIHALVKRATLPKNHTGGVFYISIHALVKRATFYVFYDNFVVVNFNPRPRKEGDYHGEYKTPGEVSISIHALVKRATCKKSLSRT